MKKLVFILSMLVAMSSGLLAGLAIKKKETIFVHKQSCPNGKCLVHNDIYSILKNLEAINHIIEEQDNESLRYNIQHRTDNIKYTINSEK